MHLSAPGGRSAEGVLIYLNRVLVEAEGEGLEKAGEVAEDLLVLQAEVEHDHVVHVVVGQKVEQRPVFVQQKSI